MKKENIKEKKFPNGFTSWMETHHEIVAAITETLFVGRMEKERQTISVVSKRYSEQGKGGMYELAEELTDEFEKMNEGREWDGEFFDEIEEFINQKLY